MLHMRTIAVGVLPITVIMNGKFRHPDASVVSQFPRPPWTSPDGIIRTLRITKMAVRAFFPHPYSVQCPIPGRRLPHELGRRCPRLHMSNQQSVNFSNVVHRRPYNHNTHVEIIIADTRFPRLLAPVAPPVLCSFV